jgi:nucleotide-binding universal stress UspA family protein
MSRLFRKILVPHDGSEHATRALDVASDLALESGGSLVVLRAIAPLVPFSELGVAEGTGWIPTEDIVQTDLDSLEKLVAKALAKRSAPPVECRVVVGDAYQSIIDATRDADSIVMATRGRTGLQHILVGSVTEKVVRHAPVPVLTIHPDARVDGTRRKSTAKRSASRSAKGRTETRAARK